MGTAQVDILAIELQGIGKSPDSSRCDQFAGLVVFHQALAAGRLGRHDRQAASHRFQCHIAEGFGDRGVEQHIHAGDPATEITSLLKTSEDCAGHAIFEPLLRRSFPDHQHLVCDISPV